MDCGDTVWLEYKSLQASQFINSREIDTILIVKKKKSGLVGLSKPR